MAEIVGDGGGRGKHKGGGPKQKKKSTRVDMTAMVDVAFLLLTFFILTTTLASQQAMEVAKPPKVEDEEEVMKDVKEDKVMTIVLGEKDQIHYWVGITNPEVKTVGYNATGIRAAIEKHLKRGKVPLCSETDNAPGCWDPIFVIKPNSESNYRNMVDVLDEMRITRAPKYALTEITPGDSALLADLGKK
jgi:biopolymer transport protein ExbD